ncbi:MULTISPECIES: carbohydrate ABC transporter permease [Heyndrickxia]|uniref:Carbohydrate ABC transporter permease n=1 Tax=Heyndrickxia sporothermodurans TaxID=46224 RepID=A0AB37HGD7_9BACI|nr:carbohydrate ABC transporter permease [Heyndrickxia sporothermodurans]MBL5768331.1 carbohydrate ABC transporter permease [Heyndrickxia sporothermodurans]MBL5771961.1 carbohydrate ABC transporter permease [Heyndrickxia sporothermodurans]MBL5775565.1 carbohydrate ABC transporter permease [Heyndrickxia sporothermodurans]MBL5779073.1 carbohydrate ABC transporter permease [Heyndrickxia sporothermodurans]MBL5782656.1 carbohydrate ABC transporter permease [Heyndrickxia sporothermodurans]
MQKKSGFLFYVLLFVFVFVVMFPFLWMLITSIKPMTELFGDKAFTPYTTNPTIKSYMSVFFDYPFVRYLWNSFVVSAITTIYTVFIASFAAYAIARFQFKGKTFILGLVLSVSMFPQIATISPIYIFLKNLGLTNSYLGLIIPYTTITLPLSIWILVTFFRKIPYDLEEAAKIDGASMMQTYWKVIFPLAAPGIFTTAILVFIAAWNEFLFALTINTDEKFKTVPVGIAMFQGQFSIPLGEIAAATIVVTIPLVILVLAFQRRIVSGLTSGSVKE